MLFRKSVAAACALAITAGLGACGGSSSSGTSPAAYVKSICQAIGPFECGLDQAVELGWKVIEGYRGHPDAAEGARAFAERRKPRWMPLSTS